MFDNWEELEDSIKNCNKCKLATNRNNIVFGVGNKQADIMFIGEGPGADEDMQGIPFVGKARTIDE
jgi:DNA polymerase